MQTNKIKIGQDYAIRTYRDGVVRGRVTAIDRGKSLYSPARNHVVYTELDIETGVERRYLQDEKRYGSDEIIHAAGAIKKGLRCEVRFVLGSWAEHAGEVLERKRAVDEADQRERSRARRIEEATATLGLTGWQSQTWSPSKDPDDATVTIKLVDLEELAARHLRISKIASPYINDEAERIAGLEELDRAE